MSVFGPRPIPAYGPRPTPVHGPRPTPVLMSSCVRYLNADHQDDLEAQLDGLVDRADVPAVAHRGLFARRDVDVVAVRGELLLHTRADWGGRKVSPCRRARLGRAQTRRTFCMTNE